MTVVVNLRTPEEEKELITYLKQKHFDFKTTPEHSIATTAQEREIIRRDEAFSRGETIARNWDDIIRDLENVYR